MVALQVILDKVNIGKLFYLEKIREYNAILVGGCDGKPYNLTCLGNTITALESDIQNGFNTEATQISYKQLLDILGSYKNSYSINSNVVLYPPLPNYTIASGGTWGYITGIIDDQLDLINEIEINNPITVQLNAGKTLGALVTGDIIPQGLNLTQLATLLAIDTINPTLNAPTSTFNLNYNGLFKIASVITGVTGTTSFDRGSIFRNWDNTIQAPRAGTFIENRFYKDNVLVATQAGNVFNYGNLTVVQGLQSYKVENYYNAGVQPLNNKGANFSTSLVAGFIAKTIQLEGVHPIYATTVSITTLTEQVLVSILNTTVLEYTFFSESGGNKQTIQFPKIFKNLVSVNYFNTVSNQYDTANKLTDFTKTSVVIGGVDYWQYTYNGVNRGSLKIKFNF